MWISCIFCSIRTMALANFLECLTSFPFGTDHQLMWFLSFWYFHSPKFSVILLGSLRATLTTMLIMYLGSPMGHDFAWYFYLVLKSVSLIRLTRVIEIQKVCLSCFATIFHKILIRIFLVKTKTTCTHRILCSFLLIEESILLLSHVQCFLCGKTQMSMHVES